MKLKFYLIRFVKEFSYLLVCFVLVMNCERVSVPRIMKTSAIKRY